MPSRQSATSNLVSAGADGSRALTSIFDGQGYLRRQTRSPGNSGGIAILTHQPYLGRLAEGSDGATREWLIDFGKSGYVALYRIETNGVVLLALRHQTEAGF